MRTAAEIGEVALRVERDVAVRGVDRARPCTARPHSRSATAPRPGRSPSAPTTGPPRSRAGSRPRSRRGRPRGSAPGTRSRSRSRSRSPARSRPSRPGWRRRTASARRCAEEWRSTASASGSSRSRVVRISSVAPSASGSRRSRASPFTRARTACSASFGPIARAASSALAPSGSSSAEPSGSVTFTSREDSRSRARAYSCGWSWPLWLIGPCSRSKAFISRRRSVVQLAPLLLVESRRRRSTPSRPARRPPPPRGACRRP